LRQLPKWVGVWNAAPSSGGPVHGVAAFAAASCRQTVARLNSNFSGDPPLGLPTPAKRVYRGEFRSG
jgi:hypothetical protein